MKNITLLLTILLFSCEDDGITPNYGCTNQDAANYDMNANVDDGSCILIFTYNQHVEPIFTSHDCTSCHQTPPNSVSNGELILTSYDDMMEGGVSGTLIDLIESYDDTVLWPRINGGGMPPNGQLSNDDLEVIKNWIEQGAKEKE